MKLTEVNENLAIKVAKILTIEIAFDKNGILNKMLTTLASDIKASGATQPSVPTRPDLRDSELRPA